MKEYQVPVEFRAYGYVNVLAENEEELNAKLNDPEFVQNMFLPKDWYYIEESYEVDFEGIEELVAKGILPLRILSMEETNSFANPDKAWDGGGYSHPLYKFSYGSMAGTFHNTSCGYYGERYSVVLGRKSWMFDGVSQGDPRHSSSFTEEDRGFIEAFAKAFDLTILTDKEVEEYNKELE